MLRSFFSMARIIALSLAVALWSAPLAWCQTPIQTPAGWNVQTKAGGAQTFVPPDLQTGEVYSVTIYESASLNGKTLEEYLRAFAGPVGKKPGQLGTPLQFTEKTGHLIQALGVYGGPNNTVLAAMFIGLSLDGGQNIHVARTLFSLQKGLSERYQAAQNALLKSMLARARDEAGDNVHVMPSKVTQKLKTVGGELTPGIYAGNQYYGQELRYRFRLHLYPNGEYRLTDHNDQDFGRSKFDHKTGQFAYNRNSGQLDINIHESLGNSKFDAATDFCYFGRDAEGKPAIYAERNKGFGTDVTSLVYVGPPNKRLSDSQEEAQKAAIEAEKNRFKWVTPPGKGVPSANIAAILVDSKYNGGSVDETVYLLLKDGTVYADLPVPPDTLDIVRSRQKEPSKWGKWRKTAAGYKVSWDGAPFQNLPGQKALPAPAQIKLNGRWGTGRSSNNIISGSYSLWGVTFTGGGRFKKDRRGGASSSIGFGDTATNTYSGYDDSGSYVSATGPNVAVSSVKKKNPNGDREGDYSINGYVLTLRYDNGKTARLPFFFLDTKRDALWFEGATMTLDKDKDK